jgi:hypothetical protein
MGFERFRLTLFAEIDFFYSLYAAAPREPDFSVIRCSHLLTSGFIHLCT